MVDISAIAGLASSLKSASDLVKAMIELRDTAAFQSKLIDLQSEIRSAQSSALTANAEQAAMADKLRQLERQLAEYESWEREKERYQLKDFGGGTFAYVLRADKASGEPHHMLCPKCFQERRKSILQGYGRTEGQEAVHCQSCERTIYLGAVRGY
jgi:hypothetical protein